MAMGARRKRQRQQALWVATATLARSASHQFYERLNCLLDECGFDEFVEAICVGPFYAETIGRWVKCVALGLVATEARAIAAIALWPRNQGALDLLDDVVSLREEEGQSMPPLTAALDEFDDRAVSLFDVPYRRLGPSPSKLTGRDGRGGTGKR